MKCDVELLVWTYNQQIELRVAEGVSWEIIGYVESNTIPTFEIFNSIDVVFERFPEFLEDVRTMETLILKGLI